MQADATLKTQDSGAGVGDEAHGQPLPTAGVGPSSPGKTAAGELGKAAGPGAMLNHATLSGGADRSQAQGPPLQQAGASLLGSQVFETDANVGRVIRGLNAALTQSGGSVVLRLTPPELGVVRIQMRLEQGAVSAQIQTENEGVRTLLSHQLGQLQRAMESHGLVVEKLQVQTVQAPAAGMTGDRWAEESASEGRSRGGFAWGEGSGQPHREGEAEGRSRGGDRWREVYQDAVNMVA